jgi:hypothetical protein
VLTIQTAADRPQRLLRRQGRCVRAVGRLHPLELRNRPSQAGEGAYRLVRNASGATGQGTTLECPWSNPKSCRCGSMGRRTRPSFSNGRRRRWAWWKTVRPMGGCRVVRLGPGSKDPGSYRKLQVAPLPGVFTD